MHNMNPKVDAYLERAKTWQKELQKLRSIVLKSGLIEELKWGQPCYTLQNKNVVLMHTFKEYCALLFFKGALLTDPKKILIQQTENVQAARQLRFTGVQEIEGAEDAISALLQEAIKVEKAGLKVNFKSTEEFNVPLEFQQKLDEAPALKQAFESLTPGRRRAYLLYFSQPKRSETRYSRVEKCADKILNGKGLNDD